MLLRIKAVSFNQKINVIVKLKATAKYKGIQLKELKQKKKNGTFISIISKQQFSLR